MAGRLVVMAAFENGTAEGIVCGDVDTTLVGKDAHVDLPVGESGTERERNVLVHGLKSLKDEGITHRRGFNVMREGGVNQVDKKGRREESDVGVVGVIRGEKVGTAGKGVRAGKELAGYVDHFEVEVSKVNKPTCLAAVKHLGLTEIGQVLVVGEDLYWEGGTMEIMAPGLQGANDCKEFSVIDVVIAFGGRE